ncbi:ribosomal protein S6 kinase delta-1 [Anabrus simplex]|uniref:ribosomal protein S6 kinase delta-1 n=1 Tax=Anabrus simplex TaxID=316456 RepID=UPI0035A3311D
MTTSSNDNWVRRFIVSDARKHKRGFTIYKVTSIVYPKQCPEAATTVVVWKRYSEFKKLHRELENKHNKLHLPDKFPSFAKAKYFGRFEDDVIEERRKSATNLLEFVGKHPPLFTSTIFVKFFESGYRVIESTESAQENRTTPIKISVDSRTAADPKPVDNYYPATLCDVNSGDSGSKKIGADGDGPLLKLGGTWQFPQEPDSISLSSRSSDEQSNLTDTDSALSGVSGVSSPLQATDMEIFDPLHPSPVTNAGERQPSSFRWLQQLPSLVVSGTNDAIKYGDESCGSATGPAQVEGHISSSSVAARKGNDKNLNVELSDELYQHVQSSQFSNPSCLPYEHVIEGSKSSVSYSQPLPTLVPDVHVQEVNYISKADYHVEQALRHEACGDYDDALKRYKAGIACLLSGVQGDSDMERKRVVREKTERYLLAAEKICNEHLTAQTANPFGRKVPESQLSRPLSELKSYKVLGIVNNVMLVLNVLEDHCYIVKVLHKSPCPVSRNKHSIIPTNVPYMVPLHRYFETESSVYLVLHHASGGRLWDHVSSYFQFLPPTPVHRAERGNVYLGKKLIEGDTNMAGPCLSLPKECDNPMTENTGVSAVTDSSSSNDPSYVELIRDYTSAKCNLSSLVSSQENICVPSDKDLPLDIPSKLSEDENSSVSVNPAATYLTADSKPDSLSTPERMEGGSEFLPDGIDTDVSKTVESSMPVSDSIPDLSHHSSKYSFSWRNLESVDTADLLENAQRLIQSVSETLLRTDAEDKSDSSVRHSANDVCDVKTGLTECSDRNITCNLMESKTEVSSNSNQEINILKCESTSKSFVRCKSEGDSCSSMIKPQERRLSRSRRCSVTTRPSVERRFSIDDLFDGRARGTSGSLDRGRQGSHFHNVLDRLHDICDRPKPRLPENTIRQWAAEILVCVDALHRWGIICRDLRPANILLGDNGHILLTYTCRWVGVDSVANTEAIKLLYAAPEVSTIFDLTPAADWWSFGALLFELAAGMSLLSCHPGGIQSHTILNIPDYVSEEAQSLIRELLRYNPQERLGSGITGTEELKAHPFFNNVDWEDVIKNSSQ